MRATWRSGWFRVFLFIAAVVVVVVLQPDARNWFSTVDFENDKWRGKKLWDWFDLATKTATPVILAIGGYLANRALKSREDARQEQVRELEKERLQQEVLKDYLDQMTQLMLSEAWLSVKNSDKFEKETSEAAESPKSRIIAIVRARTLAVLPELDGERKGAVIRFLIEVEAIPHVSLEDASLKDATLKGVDLMSANLMSADLMRANLSQANLKDATLEGANFGDTNLEYAYIESADLSKANLRGANLKYAYLEGAYFIRTYLEGANLEGANLRGANLRGALLLGLDFQAVTITPEHLTGPNAPFLCKVALPPHIKEAGIDEDRDCHRLPELLHGSYPNRFPSLEAAQKYVDGIPRPN